jgi:hypothetical protein
MKSRIKPVRRRGRLMFRPSDALLRASFAAAGLIALLVVTLQAASAQQMPAAKSQAREACGADYQRHCSGVAPGGGRIKQCLAAHIDALSEPCKQVIAAPSK